MFVTSNEVRELTIDAGTQERFRIKSGMTAC